MPVYTYFECPDAYEFAACNLSTLREEAIFKVLCLIHIPTVIFFCLKETFPLLEGVNEVIRNTLGL